MYGVSYRPDAIQHVKLGCDREGRLVAVEHRSVAATSTYEDHDENIVGWSGLAYACPNVTLKSRLARVSRPTPADMRAPGATTGVFALECAMDELAVAAGMDPVAIRLANWTDRDQNEDRDITSKAQRECYAMAAARFGWARRNAQARATREGRELVGWGMAGGVWDALVAPTPTRARVTWRTDGHLEVAAAASDIGTGTYTILAQIAADAFDIDAQEVRVRLGDSTLPMNPVEGGSWMAASTGAAVAKACNKLKRMLVTQARARHGLARGITAFKGGRIAGITIGDIVASGGKDLSALATNLPDVVAGRKYVSYSHSAVFAEVRVDEELGVIRVTRVVTAIAAGRIINPKTARSQIVGGVVMGIGYALHEEGLLDHRFGKVMNANLADYHVPANADIYDIEVIFVDEHDDKASPLGVKGVGEIGVVGVAPAIANAIFHATGRRVRDLPITLDKLL
jgi:xanthine dehydrogenase YagR molybdenum-binding subunit